MAGQQAVRTTTAGIRIAVAVMAMWIGAPLDATAQSACTDVATPLRIAGQAAAAAVVTGVEYQDMARGGAWRVAAEPDGTSVLAHPSSHLHALGSYHMARNLSDASCESTEQRRKSAWRGAALSLALGATKEVADGWYNGFSMIDLGVDAVGAGYAVAQAYVPMLRHVSPTYSVAPQAFTGATGARGAMTNYAQHTLWLSANVHDMLPESAAKAWPSAVRLSVGRRAFGDQRPSEMVMGLDLDAAKLPGSHPVWMRVKNALHHVRLPGPALVINAQGTRTVGLYW